MPDTERLAAFLFRIMRDELPTGIVTEHVTVVEAAHKAGERTVYVDEAAPLGDFARALAERLVPDG